MLSFFTKVANAVNGFELAFLGMVLGVASAMLLFTFGMALNAFPFWFGVTVASLVAARRSWKALIALWGIYLVGFCLSLMIVSCFATDAMMCYFSLARLIADGWNPVYQLTPKEICEFAKTTDFAYVHALHVPNFNPLAAATISKGLGVFNGDCFIGVVMLFALGASAFRFGCKIWNSPGAGMILALGVAITSKITNFIAGHVDYTIYASMMMTALFAGLWMEFKELRDLLMAFVSGAVAVASKAMGFPFVLLVLIILLIKDFRDKRFWTGLSFGLILSCILVLSPYIVNTIQNGSPFPSENLTSDFTGNEDAMRMGYVLRMIYAWVSPTFAKMIGSLIYHPDFEPIFEVVGGVAGYGTFFRILLLVSVLCLTLSRKNTVLLLCVCLFVSANLLPLKYIGYNRYCPQLLALPFLAVLNFLYAPIAFTKKKRLFWCLRCVYGCMVACLSLFFVLRALSYLEMSIAWQSAREHEFKLMSKTSCKWRLPHCGKPSRVMHSAMCLLSNYGIEIVTDYQAPIASFNPRNLLFSAHPIEEKRLTNFSKRFFICNSPSSLLRFDWLGAWKSPHF